MMACQDLNIAYLNKYVSLRIKTKPGMSSVQSKAFLHIPFQFSPILNLNFLRSSLDLHRKAKYMLERETGKHKDIMQIPHDKVDKYKEKFLL